MALNSIYHFTFFTGIYPVFMQSRQITTNLGSAQFFNRWQKSNVGVVRTLWYAKLVEAKVRQGKQTNTRG